MRKIKAAVKVQGSYLFFFTLKVLFVFCKGISFHPCGTRPEETKNLASHVEKHTPNTAGLLVNLSPQTQVPLKYGVFV